MDDVDVVVDGDVDGAVDVELAEPVVAGAGMVVTVLDLGTMVVIGTFVTTGATGAGLTMTTIDGGVGAIVVTWGPVAATLVPATAAGILASASSRRFSKSPTLPLRLLASATAASRLPRSFDSRSEDRMFNVTPMRVTMADRTAPTRMAWAGFNAFGGTGGPMSAPGSIGGSSVTPATVVVEPPSERVEVVRWCLVCEAESERFVNSV